MNIRYLVIILILLDFLVVLCGSCTRRRGPSLNGNRTQIKRDATPSQKMEVKVDTVYMIVPVPAENKDDLYTEDTEIVFPKTKKLKPLVHDKELPTPPRIKVSHPSNIYSREDYIANHDITGDMMDLIIACDYDNSTVRNNAVALVSVSPGIFNLGQICDIFDFCYENWSYVNDPIARDYYAKASETLRNGLNGDCDDFAILVCSMILAIGGESRISFVYNEDDGHAFAEVNIGNLPYKNVEEYLFARYGEVELNYKEEGGDRWLNLDWWGQYPGAKYWDYKKGSCFNIIRNIYQEL